MVELPREYDFPRQRVSNAEKNKPEWYAGCCDWIIAQGQNIRNSSDLEKKYRVLKGDIPSEFYKKILNPYNATNEKYTRFPATMRNYDIMKGVIRRYVSEYIKNPHDFIVGANNPEVILARNSKLRQELAFIVQEQIAAKIQESYANWVNQGNDPQQFNPQEQFNIEEFIADFNEKYIDDISAQGQEILNVIRDITEDKLIYSRAYFEWVTFGECYTYTDVIGEKIIKRVVSLRDAFPIPNDNMFAEDYDMFAERRKLTYQQIIDEFDEYLTDVDRKFLEDYYALNGHPTTPLDFATYERFYPDICSRFNKEDRAFFSKEPSMIRDLNSNLYDVWHVVWRGEIRRCIVTYQNQAGFISTRMEEDDYELNFDIGDISMEYIYVPQVYESTRIGCRQYAIYPYKARAIAYNRNGKLPYNGMNELFPGFGKFSILDIVTPFQVFYNIVAYHREMVLAKNKLNVLMIAKSLLGKVPEDTIYKMIADGVLYIDDSEDQGMLRAQQVRFLQNNIGDYLTQLTNLLADIENTAKMQVDMTPQRYGDIANSAGKGTTQEAIVRGSMGSVIIEYMMDLMRERDYARDMDYSKFAWIDGLDTSYRDDENNLKYVSVDIDKHIYADYVIKAKNSIKEQEKLDQLKQFAFSAAQNGDLTSAVAAIQGDNVAAIVKLINRFNDEKIAHENELKQLDQQLEQMKQEFELQKIQMKGEEDRKTKLLEGEIDKQIELIRADANMVSYPGNVSDTEKQEGIDRLEAQRNAIQQDKNSIERQKMAIDFFNAERDRQVKEKDIDTKLKIAKENKNKYDTKSGSKK
jgi:hypothetical protein